MITLRDIDETLEELEKAPNTFDTAHKAATLLLLRDYLTGGRREQAPAEISYSTAPEIPTDSEFLQLVQSKPTAEIWRIMDELMDTLELMLPRVHDSVIRRIMQI